MKKLIGALIIIAVLATIAWFGWRFYKSKNTPIMLDMNQVSQTLEVNEPKLQDKGFMVPVRNKSPNKVKANITIRASVVQNDERVKDGNLDITEIWEPQEEKFIFVKYSVDKPFDRSAAHRVEYVIF